MMPTGARQHIGNRGGNGGRTTGAAVRPTAASSCRRRREQFHRQKRDSAGETPNQYPHGVRVREAAAVAFPQDR